MSTLDWILERTKEIEGQRSFKCSSETKVYWNLKKELSEILRYEGSGMLEWSAEKDNVSCEFYKNRLVVYVY